MYVLRDKVFLHMVKTAGISVHQAINESNQPLLFNQRHLSIDCMPQRHRELPRYTAIREPHKWYESFYNFYVAVGGFMSFMLNDLESDGYIHPIDINEFIRRSINLKDTLLKYPNKARVFNNILQTQGQAHFIDTYFESNIDPTDKSTYDQFNMSVFEWYYNATGCGSATNIPMSHLDDLATIFKIKIWHQNKNEKPQVAKLSLESIELIKKTHSKFYKIIDDYIPLKP